MKLPLVSLSLLALASLIFAPSLARAQASARPVHILRTPMGDSIPIIEDQEEPRPLSVNERAPVFGARGEFVVTGSAGLALSSVAYDSTPVQEWGVALTPSFSYFVKDDVSLGAALEARYDSSTRYDAGSFVETKSTSFGVGPSAGVNVPLGASTSFWPQLTVGFHDSHVESRSAPAEGAPPTTVTISSAAGLWIDAYAPLLFHPAPHFFAGFGPRLYQDFADLRTGAVTDGQRTRIGGYLTIGGWWGGPAAPHDAEGVAASEPSPRLRRFGDENQIVLSSDFDVGGAWSSFSGTAGSSTSLVVGPSFDWFFVDHAFLGIELRYAKNDLSGAQPNGVSVDRSSRTLGAAARFGVDVPLGAHFSLVPRAAVGYGHGSYDDVSGTVSTHYDVSTGWGSLGAPVLAHVAQHFFIGLGPYVSHDFAQSGATPSSPASLATRVGASATVGGWL